MSDARSKILNSLRRTRPALPTATAYTELKPEIEPTHDLIERFHSRMEAVRAEVHVSPYSSWVENVYSLVEHKGFGKVLCSPETEEGKALFARSSQSDANPLINRSNPVDEWKHELFYDIDAAITTTVAGIAETGSLILAPTENEPRSWSLVPPVHIAILDSKKLYPTFSHAMADGQWEAGMPTNLLLISGPSKSADIEQTLAYGVHGPTELIVFLLSGETASV